MNEKGSVACKLDNHKNSCSNWIWVQRPRNKANCVIAWLRPKACEPWGGKEGTSGVLLMKTLEPELKRPLARTMDVPVWDEEKGEGEDSLSLLLCSPRPSGDRRCCLHWWQQIIFIPSSNSASFLFRKVPRAIMFNQLQASHHPCQTSSHRHNRSILI